MDPKVINIVSDIRDVKNIAITCRCGIRWVEKVPGVLDRTEEAIMVFHCPQCGQGYGRSNGELRRLEPDGTTPGKVVDALDAKSEGERDDKLKGKIISPGSNSIN